VFYGNTRKTPPESLSMTISFTAKFAANPQTFTVMKQLLRTEALAAFEEWS